MVRGSLFKTLAEDRRGVSKCGTESIREMRAAAKAGLLGYGCQIHVSVEQQPFGPGQPPGENIFVEADARMLQEEAVEMVFVIVNQLAQHVVCEVFIQVVFDVSGNVRDSIIGMTGQFHNLTAQINQQVF